MVFVFTASLVLAVAQATDSLTLSQALSRAREQRPRLSAASAGIERARGAARVGAIIPNPLSQLEADNLAPTHRIVATQSLAWIPRRSADLAAGRSGVDRAVADSAQLLADVGRDVKRAFFGSLAANRLSALTAEQASLADSLARFAARRAAEGDISDLERDQIVLEASRARLAAAQAREAATVAQVDLARAIAWDSPRGPSAQGDLDEGLVLSSAVGAADDIDTVPTIRGATADSSAARARLRAARIARIPIPGVVVGREWGGQTGADNLILGLAIPFPLWSQGNEVVAQARGAAAEQNAITAETRIATRALVAQTRVRVAETTARALFARDSLLPDARRVRIGAVRLYEEGRTSVVPMLDALRAERDVTRAAVAEILAFQTARADLDAALGKWP